MVKVGELIDELLSDVAEYSVDGDGVVNVVDIVEV